MSDVNHPGEPGASSADGGDEPKESSPALHPWSDERVDRLIQRLADQDAASAPEYAGAIASILAARLEGTELPEDVRRILEDLESRASGRPVESGDGA
jgi:hypothetical protein